MDQGTYKEVVAVCTTCKASYHAYDAAVETWNTCDVCRQPFILIGVTQAPKIHQKHYGKQQE